MLLQALVSKPLVLFCQNSHQIYTYFGYKYMQNKLLQNILEINPPKKSFKSVTTSRKISIKIVSKICLRANYNLVKTHSPNNCLLHVLCKFKHKKNIVVCQLLALASLPLNRTLFRHNLYQPCVFNFFLKSCQH